MEPSLDIWKKIYITGPALHARLEPVLYLLEQQHKESMKFSEWMKDKLLKLVTEELIAYYELKAGQTKLITEHFS